MKKKKSIVAHATHIPLLVRAFELSKGDVLELGVGYFSTLVLKWLCEMHGRTLYSFEGNQKWYDREAGKSKLFQKLVYISDWDAADIERHWGLAFIDHSPGKRRHVEIMRLANHADYIVIHDTEPEADKHYYYSKIWHLFKYRHDYTKCLPWTSVVSNFKKLDKF